jgi:hypothetical protein
VHADEIVRVHDSVNEPVQENSEIDITIIVDMGVEPVKEKDGNVMVHMKERQLSPLFAKDDENRVPKVPNF